MDWIPNISGPVFDEQWLHEHRPETGFDAGADTDWSDWSTPNISVFVVRHRIEVGLEIGPWYLWIGYRRDYTR